MKTFTSLSQIIKAADGKTLYIRWSRGPAMDRKQGRSLDQIAGRYHSGLSAQAVRADRPELFAQMLVEYRFLRRKDARIYCWILEGEQNGTDSDGAPTIDAETIVPVGRVSEELIDKCTEFSFAYWRYRDSGHRAEGETEVKALLDAAMGR